MDARNQIRQMVSVCRSGFGGAGEGGNEGLRSHKRRGRSWRACSHELVARVGSPSFERGRRKICGSGMQ